MRIAIVGSGGVGGYFGARLAAAGADVSFLARGAHLDAMRSKGLTINSFKGDLHLPRVTATDNPAAIGPADIVLFTVKLYDTAAATRLLAPLVGPETAVIPLQNGVDGVDIVANAVGRPHTAGGTVYVAAVITQPGVIKHSALDHSIFGELDRNPDAASGATARRLQARWISVDAQRQHPGGYLDQVRLHACPSSAG